MKRDQKVLERVHNLTLSFLAAGSLDFQGTDAASLAIDLKLDRSNVSRILNDLWKDKLLIKILGRPTLFLDTSALKEYYPNQIIPSVIARGEKLSNFLSTESSSEQAVSIYPASRNSLDDLICANGTLNKEISLAKAAAAYPPHGLPTYIYGNEGVGKRRFAKCIYQFALENDILKKNAPFISVSCHTLSNDPGVFRKQLLGVSKSSASAKSQKGFLDLAQNGILFFEGFEALPPSSLDLLTSVIKKLSYTRVGDVMTHSLDCMLLFSSHLPPEDPALSMLTNVIPASLKIPDLNNWSVSERFHIVLSAFSKEASAIGCMIRIHKEIFSLFVTMNYERNITELKNDIRSVCSKAYLTSFLNKQNIVYITWEHLSDKMLNWNSKNNSLSPEILDFLSHLESDSIIFDKDGTSSIDYVLQNTNSVAQSFTEPDFLLNSPDSSIEDVKEYLHSNILSLNDCGHIQLETIKKNINPVVYSTVITELKLQDRYPDYHKHLHLLYGILLHITNVIKREAGTVPVSVNLETDTAVSKKLMPEEFKVVCQILKSLSRIYNITFHSQEIDFIASYFSILNQWSTHISPGILLICHGNSTAADMVSCAREKMKGDYALDFINFSPDMTLEDCLSLACVKAKELNHGAGVLFLCDLEPLTTIGEYIQNETDIPIRVLSPVTLPLLLKCVEMATSNTLTLQELPMESGTKEFLSNEPSNEFVRNLLEKVLKKNCIFLDIEKAVTILTHCLENTLADLNRSLSNEIAAKYLCHCCNMLERVIRKEFWNYSNLNTFVNTNAKILHIVEQNLEYAEASFGINIPSSELAYIAEIFL